MEIRKTLVSARQKLAIEVQKRFRTQVSTDQILFGAQGGYKSAARWSMDMGDFTLPSLPVEKWPHTELLKAYDEQGESIFSDDNFRETFYFRNAMDCIREYSRFTWCRNEDDVKTAALYLVTSLRGENVDERRSTRPRRKLPVILRKIKNSKTYQACDGHHRIAKAAYLNQEYIECFVNPWPIVYTPVQEKIISLDNTAQCLQELESVREVSTWPVLYGIKPLADLLDSVALSAKSESLSVLDLAASYGGMIRYLRKYQNVKVTGVEHRRIARDIAVACNGVNAVDIRLDNYRLYLAGHVDKFDIVMVNIDRMSECTGPIDRPLMMKLFEITNRHLCVYSRNRALLDNLEKQCSDLANSTKDLTFLYV